MNAPQQTFDWTKEKSECVEGLKLDPEEEYTFTLDDVSLHNLVRKDGTVVTRKDGTESRMYSLKWAMADTSITLKMDFFKNEKERVNPEHPENESEFVKLSRKLGYKPVIGGAFAPSDFLQLGMTIKAHVKELPPNPDGKVYNAINIDTITCDGTPDTQAQIPDAIPDDIQKEILTMAKGCKKQSDLSGKINKAKKYNLLQPMMQMVDQGILKF
jgi:hypothetical protein